MKTASRGCRTETVDMTTPSRETFLVNRREKIFIGIRKSPEQRERETDWIGTGLEGRE